MSSYFILLLVALYASLVSGDVYYNMDCGSSQGSFDTNFMMWLGDDSQNGISEQVKSSYSVSTVMDTLQVFTTRNKNCYDISATEGERILVRASFLYGNYDGKSSPPSFALQFDGNDWVTVETLTDQVVYEELIYTVKGDYASICVAQTNPDQFPFISAIEARSLASTMYDYVNANYALYLHSRVAYGADSVIGYADDLAYDRLWIPAEGENGVINVTSDALFFLINQGDYPPLPVLMNAATPSDNTSSSLKLVTDFPSDEVSIYMNLYFSEVTELDASENRSFILYKDGEAFADTLVPPYGGFIEYTVYNLTVSSNTTLSLVATTNSTLPPIINALEIFFISDVLTDGTNTKDVEGLDLLQNTFPILASWGGDPCLPAPYSWEWINCSSDPIPRVTELHLRSFSLSGELPDFSSMDALQIIDLKNNSLNGEIPDFLGQLPKLKQLNLANNQFAGPIPSSLSTRNDLKLDVTDNPDLCTTSQSCQTTTDSPTGGTSFGTTRKKSNKLPIILGTTIPSFLIIWLIVAIFVIIPHYKKRAAIAAANAGQHQHNGATTPHETAVNSFMNEITNNISDQVGSQLAGQILSNQQTTVP